MKWWLYKRLKISYISVIMVKFGGVSFLNFCDLKLNLGFLDFKGSFFSLIFEF